MDTLALFILGLVQGIAEFLPISSSGHLVLVQEFFELKDDRLFLNILTHLATALAIIIYYRHDILELLKAVPTLAMKKPEGFDPSKNDYEDNVEIRYNNVLFVRYILVSMVPTGIIGLSIKKTIEDATNSVVFVYAMLFITGVILLSSKFIKEKHLVLTYKFAILIGIAQGLAAFPGISRSGTTIVLALFLGLARPQVARFSFLMSLPVILGVGLLEAKDIFSGKVTISTTSTEMLIAFTTAAVAGYFSIGLINKILKNKKFEYFGYYCLSISIAGLLYSL